MTPDSRPSSTCHRTRTSLALMLLGSCMALLAITNDGKHHTVNYEEPIDALSVGTDRIIEDLEVSAYIDGAWTAWYELETENEQDPVLLESNLIIFPDATRRVRFRGSDNEYAVHPLAVSKDPVSYKTAALLPSKARPKILTREQWGADDSLLYANARQRQTDDMIRSEGNGSLSQKEQECETKKRLHPQDFAVSETVDKDRRGRYYKWEKRYSPEVKMLVVHHTASAVHNDERDPVERMRLLYKFHTVNRGWGDIGYHYVIDEEGRIYEGRDGGKYVVGGHAYCANVGTVGVALMGNFDEEQPGKAQARSLQWLLKQLADDYDIDLERKVMFRGELLPTIVGHRDLSATSCPGTIMAGALSQVRRNVRRGTVNTDVRFPRTVHNRYHSRSDTPWYTQISRSTLTAIGQTEVSGRPGSQARISLRFDPGDMRANRRDRIADVERSNSRIGIWQEFGGREMRVRNELILPETVRSGETYTIQLRIQFPREEGIYTLKFDDAIFILKSTGRQVGNEFRSTSQRSVRSTLGLTPSLTRVSGRSSAPTQASTVNRTDIRIRLGYADSTATVAVPRGSTVSGQSSRFFRIDLKKIGDDCVASEYGRELARGIPRIEPAGDGVSTIRTWETNTNRFRGVLECRIVDGELTIINELPLETYLKGLAEEPDSEPYQKQRAFAIAARSYAAHYMSPSNRKFPGKPYDGDDSPARFQKYGGVLFEEHNPMWVDAVESTSGVVVKKNGQVVKTPYFSANDGRTKSPREAGWNRFPFEEVFESKPDPWCEGMVPRGHGVGMSGCGSRGQALEGKTGEEILMYYYPTTRLERL